MIDNNITKIVADYVRAINKHSIDNIVAKLSDNHLFIDSLGQEFKGSQTMREGWLGYFEWFPDYQIDYLEVFQNDNIVMINRHASACYRGDKTKHWRIPAVFRAKVEYGLIAEWQVFADNRPAYEQLAGKIE